MAVTDPCAVIDALARFQYDVIRRINRKFEMLRRLATLIEQLGDLSPLVPNINSLIPVYSIDLSAYNQLAAACPFLNLPAPGEASLNQLRSWVIAAYANLAREILNHAYFRLGGLQTELSKFQTKINSVLGTGLDFIQCLQAACQAVAAAGSAFQYISTADISGELSRFAKGYAANAGEVLTQGMKTKYETATTTVDTLKNLGADIGDDYATAKAALTPSASVEVSVDQTGVDEYTNPPFLEE